MSINLSVPAGATIPELKPKLTVIGVGGAGGNAVNILTHGRRDSVGGWRRKHSAVVTSRRWRE